MLLDDKVALVRDFLTILLPAHHTPPVLREPVVLVLIRLEIDAEPRALLARPVAAHSLECVPACEEFCVRSAQAAVRFVDILYMYVLSKRSRS